jgi:ribonuclease HI
MFEVNIYLETSLKGPVIKDGWYAAVLEYKSKGGKITTREDFEWQKDTTYHRQSVCAFLKSLKRLNASCIVNVYTDSVYLKNGIEDHLKMWKSNGWINGKGNIIKNAQEWQEISKLIAGHKIRVHREKRHEYTEWMMEEAKKRFKNAGTSVNTERERIWR